MANVPNNRNNPQTNLRTVGQDLLLLRNTGNKLPVPPAIFDGA
jgi:hypothetical protein